MKTYLRFLARAPLWWLGPIVVYVALLAWLAWRAAHTAASPFTYQL